PQDGSGAPAPRLMRAQAPPADLGGPPVDRRQSGLGSCQRAGRKCRSATPTARLSPTWPVTETGCSATVRLEPPTSTLAPRTADQHLGAEPAGDRCFAGRADVVAGQEPGATYGVAEHAPPHHAGARDPQIEAELGDRAGIEILRGPRCIRSVDAGHLFLRSDD